MWHKSQEFFAFATMPNGLFAVEEVPREETLNYGIVQPEAGPGDVFRIVNLVEKPSPADAPSNLAIAGRYIFSPLIT